MYAKSKANYANDECFDAVLERYGGEDSLKKNFPRILQMLYDTRKWHQSAKFESTDDPAPGYQDTFRITELPTPESETSSKQSNDSPNKKYAVYADSLMSLANQTQFLHMSSKTIDPHYGKTFGAYAVHAQNDYKLEKSLKVDASFLSYCNSPEVQTTTSFVAVGKVNGVSVCVNDEQDKTLTIDLAGMAPDITDITVNAPCSKNEEDTYIRVVYNGRTDKDAAYNFVKSKDRTIDNVRYVDVYYPFTIVVTLDEMYKFDPSNPVNFDYNFLASLASNVVKGGEVHFNSALWGKITPTARANVLTLDFPYSSGTEENYWGTQMPLTAKQADGYFDFHLNFTVNYGLKDSAVYDFETDVVVCSENLPPSPNLKKIKQSRILWGCLGKDTMIRVEKGYKKISEINVGEKIFTDKGYIPLKNMVTGTEEKIIAVGVSEDKTLLITKKHPIATDRGIIQAIDLAATDKLMLEDGTYSDIYYLEVIDYNDKVYCPELEKPALIEADGLMVGDYLTPATEIPEKAEEPEPLEPELVEELIRWTKLKNEQLQKEVNV